jgi:hypothetical protein
LGADPVPNRQLDEDLAEFPVRWVLDRSLTGSELKIVQDSGAHFLILGEITIEFADYLRDNCRRIPAEELNNNELSAKRGQ